MLSLKIPWPRCLLRPHYRISRGATSRGLSLVRGQDVGSLLSQYRVWCEGFVADRSLQVKSP